MNFVSWFTGVQELRGGPSSFDPTPVRLRINRYLKKRAADSARRETAREDFMCIEASATGKLSSSALAIPIDASIAGEALFRNSKDNRFVDRQAKEIDQLRLLKDEQALLDLLASSRGTFAFYLRAEWNGDLYVGTDKLGVRPIYYAVIAKSIVFSTSLPSLHIALGDSPGPDWNGIIEELAFGYPLGNRTRLSGVSLVPPSSMIRISDDGVVTTIPYHADSLKPEFSRSRYDPELIYRTFIDSVELRAFGTTDAAAFLSGGLDSRAVCAALRQRNMELHTAVFSRPKTLNAFCSVEAARMLGTTHEVLQKSPMGKWDSYSRGSVLEWTDRLAARKAVSHPRFVWGGDGGSVGLGCVYMKRDQKETAETRGLAAALLEVRPPRFYRGALRSGVLARAEQGIRSAIEYEASSLPAGSAMELIYRFLIRTDQRSHLFSHFDNILDGGIEFHLPFYDADFIEAMYGQPTEMYLGHAGYMDVLAQFEVSTTSTAWQAYPGHVPCDIPVPSDLSYQWSKMQAEPADIAASQAATWGALCCYTHIGRIMRLSPLVGGLVRQRFSKKDLSYLSKPAALFASTYRLPIF